ncbi:MAG: thioredoxin domain-containing protein [Pseudonocardia sp.]|nr:thioredoxin domain-containing protein [Pseudonocardia sp.]
MMAKKTRRRPAPVVTQRRGPSLGMIIGVVVVLLFAGAVGFGIYYTQHQRTASVAVPQGATADGIPVGHPNAPATVDLYIDFQCPICRQYEQQSGQTLEGFISSGAARVVYHPVAFLDRVSAGYSSRASAAAGCASQEGVFPAFLTLMYANQPPENGTGLPPDKIIALGQQAGAGPGFAQCVTANTFGPWATALTETASKGGVNATPTVKVNGQEIDNTDQALRQAVQAAH